MLRTGICNIEQLQAEVAHDYVLGHEKRASVTLLDAARKLPDADKLIERILLTFTDDRGAYKRTYANRFDDFDHKCIEIMLANFSRDSQITLHDVAVSDGRTAVDFYKHVKSKFANSSYIASDYNAKVYVIADARHKVVLSNAGDVIEFVAPPLVFNAARPDSILRQPITRLLQKIVWLLYIKPLLRKYKAGMFKAHELLLFNAQALMLADQDKSFVLQQHNLLQPFSRQYQVIRAMNVLNPSYFSAVEFKQILSNIYVGLNVNGLFMHGSNQDAGSVVNGAIYRKTEHGFELLYKSGAGSYMHDMMQNIA